MYLAARPQTNQEPRAVACSGWIGRKEDDFMDPKWQVKAFCLRSSVAVMRKHVGLRAGRAAAGLNLWQRRGPLEELYHNGVMGVALILP